MSSTLTRPGLADNPSPVLAPANDNPAKSTRAASPTAAGRVVATAATAVEGLAAVLTRFSVPALRVSLGLVFLGFGVLKFFPGVSPAQELVERTLDALSFGLVGPGPALLLTAVMETAIGLTLVTGKFLRAGLVLLAGALVGIMSPIVLFFHELFPAGGPTIVGQYVLKDIVLAAAAAVVAATALGARLTRD